MISPCPCPFERAGRMNVCYELGCVDMPEREPEPEPEPAHTYEGDPPF